MSNERDACLWRLAFVSYEGVVTISPDGPWDFKTALAQRNACARHGLKDGRVNLFLVPAGPAPATDDDLDDFH
ncbi:MAG: hypothetical protein AAGK37_23570 [Pseudomonadota bacterium]